jgi:Flp pilus assembly protein CpaB
MTILAEDSGASRTGGGGVGSGGGGRSVSRRRNALNGRALGGGLLIAAAAVVVFAAWLGTSGGSGHPVVVVDQPLAAGATLQLNDLTTASVRLPAATTTHTFSSPLLIVGRILAAPLAPGELVQSSDLVPSGHAPPLRPVAVSIDSSDAGALSVGDLVDVVVTDGSDSSSPTTVVVRGARVLAVDSGSGGFAGADTTTVVTIGVGTLDEVTAVIHAARTGTVNVVVGEPGDGTGLAAGASGAGGSGAGGSGS